MSKPRVPICTSTTASLLRPANSLERLLHVAKAVPEHAHLKIGLRVVQPEHRGRLKVADRLAQLSHSLVRSCAQFSEVGIPRARLRWRFHTNELRCVRWPRSFQLIHWFGNCGPRRHCLWATVLFSADCAVRLSYLTFPYLFFARFHYFRCSPTKGMKQTLQLPIILYQS